MNIITIARRELRSIFNTTIGWLVLAGFLLLTGIFWSSMVRFYVQQSTDVVANPYAASYMSFTDYLLAPFFGNTAVVLLLLCPALSMRLFSEEMKQKTLELLLTSPVSTLEIVLGKYLGAMGFVVAMLAGTAIVPVSLYIWGEPDLGAFIGGYAGMLLISAATIAMGMMFSSFTQNQIVALVWAFSGALTLWVLSWVSQSPDNFFVQIAMISHVEDLIKGVVRVSDLAYFASFIGFFVFATWQQVESAVEVGMEKLARWSWVFLLLGFFVLMLFASLLFVSLFTEASLGPWTYGTGGAIALVGLFIYLEYEKVKIGAASRAFRYGLISVVMVTLAFGIAVAGFVIAKDHDHRWDLTEEKRFSISEKTKSVVAGLDRDVEIFAFFRSGSAEEDRFKSLIEGYEQESYHLKVSFIDPMRRPRMAERYTITSEYGTVVMVAGEDRQRLESEFKEEAVTDALIRLLSGEDHTICWSTGHGELDPDDDTSPEGLGGVVLKLEDQNYTFTKVNVLTEGVPRDCEALVIARPIGDWLPIERESLAVYLAEEGRVLVMLEPETAPELSRELERYGVTVGNDVVLDIDPRNRLLGIEDPTFIVLMERSYAYHPITSPLKAMTILGVARSVSGARMLAGVTVHELLTASQDSWGETSLDADPNDPAGYTPNEGVDLVGDVPLMVAIEIIDPDMIDVGTPPTPEPIDEAPEPADGDEASAPVDGDEAPAPEEDDSVTVALAALLGGGMDFEDVSGAIPEDFKPKPGGRLVVVGDADFASNQLLALGNNQDLFTNSIAWLVDEEDQISQGPEGEADLLTLNLLEEALLLLFSVFIIPGAAVFLAVLVMLRRRFL